VVTPARDFRRFDEDEDSAYFADSAEPGRAWTAAETFEHTPSLC
jgi:hypothetical protein